MRLTGLASLLLLCMMIAVPPAVFPDETAPPPKPGVEKDSALDESVRKGLEYLAKSQDPNTGAIGDPSYKLASTSLAGMAFLSGGNLPGRGLYGKNVEMAIRFILNNATSPSGYMQHESSNMYSHGFATLFLAEAYGTVPPYMKLQPKMYKVLKKSIDLIERCQSPEGGWWYNPTKSNAGQGADISVTVCETNALRAARNCGVAVDKRVVENALKCVKGAQNDDGGFSYRTYVERRNDGSSAVPRSAGAVCILQSLGAYTDLETQKGIDYLKRSAVDQKVDMSQLGATYYALYYLSQSMFMSGMKNWNEWWPKVKALLLSKQGPDGGWQGEGGKGYGTAVALIILQMPYRYLPIYQEGIENADNTPAETPAP